MIHSTTVIVVPPGYPPDLIDEFLGASILRSSADIVVLLPPDKIRQYDRLIKEQGFSGVSFLPSPGRRFFSTIHLKWLQANLQCSENIKVLTSGSLDRDITGALVVVITQILSRNTISYFRKTNVTSQEKQISVTCLRDHWLISQWTAKEFNKKILFKEVGNNLVINIPGLPVDFTEIIYFLMFSGLILKKSIINFLLKFLHILQIKFDKQ